MRGKREYELRLPRVKARIIPDEAVAILIEIGSSLDWGDPFLSSRIKSIKRFDYVNREYRTAWDAKTTNLTTEEIVQLIKGLVAAEEVGKWTGGSVSGVIWVYHELQRRDDTLAEKIGDWVLQHTTNDYLPEGRSNFGAKSVAEARRRLTEHEERARKNSRNSPQGNQ